MSTPAFTKRPRNKSNMDAPQEEFIAPSASHVEPEVQPAPQLRRPPLGRIQILPTPPALPPRPAPVRARSGTRLA